MAMTSRLYHEWGGSRRARDDSLQALTTRPQRWVIPPRPRSDPAHDSDALADSTLEVILAEFMSRWQRGENPCAEEYLDRLAPDHVADAVELIYREYCLAESAGLSPDP